MCVCLGRNCIRLKMKGLSVSDVAWLVGACRRREHKWGVVTQRIC